eukprot:3653534-Pyramimonas_sp.AAC.1
MALALASQWAASATSACAQASAAAAARAGRPWRPGLSRRGPGLLTLAATVAKEPGQPGLATVMRRLSRRGGRSRRR